MRSSSDDERTAFLSYRPPSRTASTERAFGTAVELTTVREDADVNVDADADTDDALLQKLDRRHILNRRRPGFVSRVFAVHRLPRRTVRGVLFFTLKYVVAVTAALLMLTPMLAPSYLSPPAHYGDLAARCEGASPDDPLLDGCANPFHEKVFISVSLYDRAGHLAGGPWGDALVELIHLIGPSHVFLSIYENDSGPEGAAALERLRQRVPSRHEMVYEEHVPLSAFPNVTLPDGTVRTKRLAYLTELRNRALQPLDSLERVDHVVFDKVLFLNDVAFRALDAAQLLFSTHANAATGRTEYLSACALDWKYPFLFYDVYAQRDADGFSNGVPIFPIFSGAGSGRSRAAMLAQADAVPVRGCWGGMVAMRAEHVQHRETSLPRPDFQDVASHVLDPAHPEPVRGPVRFRYEPELFVDGCECCLLLADVAQAAAADPDTDTDTDTTGQYVNPYVRVAYKWSTLRWLRVAQRWERLLVLPHMVLTTLARLPTHNPHRTVQEGERFVEEVWDSDAGAWVLETRTGRSGMFCGVREMQVVREGDRKGDINWENADIPAGQKMYFPS